MNAPSNAENNLSDYDRVEESVDPRVQVELERLNAATDDINKLEVDLDESRAGFRQLLCDSSVRIESLAKKLGACVEKARPYYEARIKAKEALHETQLAAVRFERANSAHAAAKEMVYLAEEGLCAEGRTFDHAWQEMLNHATMRVNESELERTLSETEHRRTSRSYQCAETRVQQLQRDLKRTIAKSSLNARRALLTINQLAAPHLAGSLPYFEMKAQFNHLLEEQKMKVKRLERRVSDAKANYAEALRNLEMISDEIHRLRKFEIERRGRLGDGEGCSSRVGETEVHNGQTPSSVLSPDTRNTSSSTNIDTDRWTDSTGSADSDEEYLKLPEKIGPTGSPIIPHQLLEGKVQQPEYMTLRNIDDSSSLKQRPSSLNKLNTPSSPCLSTMEMSFMHQHTGSRSRNPFIPLSNEESPEGENVVQSLFAKIVPLKLRNQSSSTSVPSSPRNQADCKERLKSAGTNDNSCSGPEVGVNISALFPGEGLTLEDESTVPYKQQWSLNPVYCLGHNGQGETSAWSEVSISDKTTPESKGEVWTEVNLNDARTPVWGNEHVGEEPGESASTVKQDVDKGISNWISRSSAAGGTSESESCGSRRQSFDTLIMGGLATGERVKEILSQGILKLNISSLTERRSSESRPLSANTSNNRKAPSPLEKTMTYLNPDDDSTSDSESLASVEMLSDEQISSLMLDQNIQEACIEVLGTPINELGPIEARFVLSESKSSAVRN